MSLAPERALPGKIALPVLLLLSGSLMLGTSGVEAKKKAKRRQVDITVNQGAIATSFSFRDVFSAKVLRNLPSGLPTRVVVQVNLERRGKRKPVVFWVRSTTIVYDLWEECYLVTVEDDRGWRRARGQTLPQVVDLAGLVADQEIGRVGELKPGTYRLRVVAEVNPVSKEMVRNIRRWLARPRAGQRDVETQSNFFGSFVGIFVDRRIGKAERTVTFVSQWFEVGDS